MHAIYLDKYQVAIYGRILLTDQIISLNFIKELANIISFRVIITERRLTENNLIFIRKRYHGDRILHIGPSENAKLLEGVSDNIFYTNCLNFDGEFIAEQGLFFKEKLVGHSLESILAYMDTLPPSSFEGLFIAEDWTTTRSVVTHVENNTLNKLLSLKSSILHRIFLMRAGLKVNIIQLLEKLILTLCKERNTLPARIVYETSLRIRDRLIYLYKGKIHGELQNLVMDLPLPKTSLPVLQN
jgi:hypothetical protein